MMPFGHRPRCRFASEGPHQVSLLTPQGSAWRAVFSGDGTVAALDIMPSGSRAWQPAALWPEDIVATLIAMRRQTFWPCSECGGFISRTSVPAPVYKTTA